MSVVVLQTLFMHNEIWDLPQRRELLYCFQFSFESGEWRQYDKVQEIAAELMFADHESDMRDSWEQLIVYVKVIHYIE